MPTVFDVANYFIVMARAEREDGLTDDAMTHLKLQKLVYYAQGFNLAINGKPLFNEPIEAWVHGPVCPALYGKYKSHGRRPISSKLTLDEAREPFTKKQLEVLGDVYEYFGCLTASKLRQVSHSDHAWIAAWDKGGIALSLQDMKESCKERVLK